MVESMVTVILKYFSLQARQLGKLQIRHQLVVKLDVVPS